MSKLSAEAFALIRAGRNALDPTDADQDRILALLEARLGAGIAPNPPNGIAKSSFATGSRLWAAFGVPVVGIGVAWLIVQHGAVSASTVVHGPPAEAARPVENVPASAAPPGLQRAPEAPPAGEPAPLPTTRPSEAAGAGLRSTARVPLRPGVDTLSSEVALLGQGTLALNQGQPAQALATFEEHERKFPAGALAEDRMAGEAEALCALGRTREAKGEVTRLVAQYPGSSHLKHVRAACGWGAAL